MASLWSLINASDPAATKPWLRWHPRQLDECVKARADHPPVPPPDSPAMEEMTAAHVRWGGDEATMGMLARLAEPTARVVVAGQQPALLASPLLVIYKTLAALYWARELERRHGTPFVPVFWCASEDDDFDEVRRVHWPGAHGQLEEVLLDRLDPRLGWSPGKMLGTLTADFLGERLAVRITESSIETGFRPSILQGIGTIHAPGSSWEDAFCRTLLKLLPGSGLVIVSPLMRWVRRRAAAVVRGEIERPGASTRAVLSRAEALRAAGFDPQLHRRPDAANFFLLDETGCRHSVRICGEMFESHPPGDGKSEAANGVRAYSATDLIHRLEESPESFGLNAVTRPVVQDSILPTVAQMVGPGEAAYLGQVEGAYDAFGAFAPVRMPRPQAVLVSNAVARALKKYELSTDDALALDARALGRIIIEREFSGGVAGDLADMKDRQIAELRAWAASAGNNPSILSAVEKLAQAMTKGFDTLRDRVLYSRQEDERHLAGAMIKIENNLRPGGLPQERALNPVVPFAVNHGWGWAMRLGGRLSFEPGSGIQVVEPGSMDPDTRSTATEF